MKAKKKCKKFVLTVSNRTEACIFCDELLGVERAFRRGIRLDRITANERIAEKIHRALQPLLEFAGLLQRNPTPHRRREVGKVKAQPKKVNNANT